jgi:hypothetical protein
MKHMTRATLDGIELEYGEVSAGFSLSRPTWHERN